MLRKQSALATARKELPGSAVEESAQKKDLPHFKTLEGSISPHTLKALTQKPMELTYLSPVQAEVFPLLPKLAEPYDPNADDRNPRDLLVKARTGTGKTLAFLLPAVEARLKAIEAAGKQAVKDAGLTSDTSLELRARKAFAQKNLGTLIISPTRELATQIAIEAQRLTSHLGDFGVCLFVGGTGKGFQMRDWTRGRRDILVSTPGRLRDFLVSEPEVASGLAKTQLFVLDEADTLLDMGFRPDIDAIAEYLPPSPERQTFLFSATVSKPIQQIAKQMLDRNHRFINCVPVDSSPVHAHVPQYHTVLHNAQQQTPHVIRLLAHDQLANPGASKTIVFLPTTKMTQLFASTIRELSKSSLPAGRNTRVYEIHSKRTMDARTNTSNQFRSDTSGASILISSDVSARGVDYPNVTRVIQVGIPSTPDQYIHRVGRTGRAGTKGRGDLVLLPWELHYVTQSLSDLSLRPLKQADLTEETLELAKKFDENPREFFAHAPWTPPTATRIKSSRDRQVRLPVTGPSMFQGPVVEILEGLEQNVSDLVARFDEEGIKETFLSLLGYYSSRTDDMRASRETVLDGLKAWTCDACGLSKPVYISPTFLNRIGFGTRDKPMQNRMQRDYQQFGQRPGRRNKPSWEVRGSRKATYGGITERKERSPLDTRDEEDGGYRSRGSRDTVGGREDGGGYGYAGIGYGGRGGSSHRGNYKQRGSGGYSQGSRGGYRGGQEEGGRGNGYGYGGGRGREDRHRDAGETGFGLKR